MINQLKYVVGVLFAAILVYGGLWYTAAFEAEKDVAAMFSQWRDKGLRVEHGKIEAGGFPYRITVTVSEMELKTRANGLELAADSIILITHLWTPNHWLAEVHGVTGSLADNSTKFTDNFLHASYKLHENGKTIIVLNSHTFDDFSLARLLGETGPKLSNWEVAFMLDDSDTDGNSGLYGSRFLDFKISGNTANHRLEFTGGISGPVISDWRKTDLAKWRDEGGLIELDNIDYMVPGGRVKGSASFTLDENFMPLGSASLVRSGTADLRSLITSLGYKSSILPGTGPASIMLQNSTLTLNGERVARLTPVIK